MVPHVSLRLDLFGEEADRFLAVKDMLGLHSNVEVVRVLITYYLRREGATGLRPIPSNVSPRILELAVQLGTDPAKLASDLPQVLKEGRRAFGMKSLEVYRDGEGLHARVWIDQRCIYSASV
jgi:hypothetical protein